jgi:hypothetical protein
VTTTNQPGAGPNWPADAQHGSAPDDHGGGGGVSPEALRLRHEPDVFAVKPIMSIPFAVLVSFVIAFAVAAGVFAYMANRARQPDPFAHPQGVARGSVSLNERLARISEKGATGVPSEVDAPRLEPLKRLAGNDKPGTFQVTTQPELPTGNSPWFHPEELMPGRYGPLNRAEYTDKDKKTARIPVGDAMKLVVEKGMLPARKDASRPVPTADRPSESNAGRGGLPVAPKAEPAAKKDDTPKAPAPTAPEPKAPEPKAPEKK